MTLLGSLTLICEMVWVKSVKVWHEIRRKEDCDLYNTDSGYAIWMTNDNANKQCPSGVGALFGETSTNFLAWVIKQSW